MFTDWGQHPLKRELFAEEFEFMVKRLDLLITLNEVEIVAEFVHCLKILQYTPASDPELVPLVERAYEYLLSVEEGFGGTGSYCREDIRNKTSDQPYHASLVAAFALSDFNFSENEELRLNPPLPDIVRYFHW